jgi:ribosomal protein S18 acetylase RimI-like enzyme
MTETDVELLASAFGWPPHGIQRRFQEQLDGKREAFVAALEDNPVGSVSTNLHSDVPALLHLFALDVASRFRNLGLGTALIQWVERIAVERGLDGVWLDVAVDNANAKRLYERLGYRQEGPTVLNRWSYVDEDGTQREAEETCYRMYKRFAQSISP